MHLRRLALFSLLFVACSGTEVEPRSGTWNYGGSDLATNSCGGVPPTDASGAFTLTVTADGAFTINDGDFETTFECTYKGDEYECPNRAAGSYKVDALDATVFYEVSATGTIVSESELTGTMRVKLRCEGASCALAAELSGYTPPCEYTYTFNANAQ